MHVVVTGCSLRPRPRGPRVVASQVLTQSLKSRNNALYRVFGSAYAVTTTLYTTASIVIVLYFGNGTKASVNVNWSKFTGGYASGQVWHLRACGRVTVPPPHILACVRRVGQEPWWVLFISYMVVLFPALDVISVMPINGIIVASNIMSAVYGDKYGAASHVSAALPLPCAHALARLRLSRVMVRPPPSTAHRRWRKTGCW